MPTIRPPVNAGAFPILPGHGVVPTPTQGPPGPPGEGDLTDRDVAFRFNTPLVKICDVPANCIIKYAQILITEYFDDPLAYITIGTADDPEAIVKRADSKATFPDQFVIDIDLEVSTITPVNVYVHSSTGTRGAGKASVTYTFKES